MAIKKFSTNWNKEKVMELVMLSGHGDLANEGNQKSQRLIKELKQYLFTDKKNYTIANDFNISLAQFEKDMKYWKDTYQRVKSKSLILQEEVIKYHNITGTFSAYIPSLNKSVSITLKNPFTSLDEVRLDVRKQISNALNMKLIDLKNIEFELNLKWNVDIK